uniref:Uncharacterized protein n=1 Tax=Tetradesmus obliquus TaxID=3088 RepID=A0A383WGY9_TETOB|eukprot:jgi/Sobl393_1/2708/SZX76690.1
MGKPGPRKTRGVVGIEESSEDDDKPVAQTMRPRQSHDGGDAAADRAPKRQRTASEDGARRARGAAAAEPTADDQQAHPAAETVAAAAAAAAAAADAMEVEAQEQQQQHEAETAAHPQQHNSKEPDTPFAAAMESAFPALPHAHSSGHGAAGADDAAAAAGSGRQRHSSRQHKAVQQQLQPERTVSRSLSSMPSYKLPNRTPFLSKMRPERKEKARMPWHGADDHWGDGFPGMSDQLPPGAEALAEPPLQEASVGWGIWLFYNKEDDPPAGEQQEEGEQQEQDEQQQEQQQQESEAEEAEQPQEPTPGTWWRGMVWWFSQKEAKYKLVFEDGEYDPNVTKQTMAGYLKKGECYFSRPPCNWPPPQHLLREQPSGASVDAHAEQQHHEQEAAAASGKRTKQQMHKQEHRKPQLQQQQAAEEQAALGGAEGQAAADDEAMQPATAAAEQPRQPAKQQHHKQQHHRQQQQRPYSGQQHKKQQQQQPGPHSQGQKQRKHSAGAAGSSRPAGSKPQPPASPGLPSAEAAAAAATAAAAGLSPQKAAAAAAGQQRARSVSARPLPPLRQQQPDLSGLSADAARLAGCLLKLRDGTELVKQGLALQKQALQELPAGLTSEQVSRFAREVKTALSVGEDKTGAQLLTTVKHLAEDHWGLLPGSQEVHGGAEQLYQQMLQKRKPPGTPSKAAAAAVKQEGEWAAAAAAGGSSASLQDLAAAGAGGGLGKRGRDGSIKQEHAAAAAAEQPSPSYQQDADKEPGAAAGVDGGNKGTWDLAHFQSLVPVRCLDDPLRDTAVALLSAVLQPPAAASPFALAHELEAKLHDQHGMIGPGKHMYLRHLYMIWCVLGGRELAAAAEAAQRARAAAAEGGDEDAAAAAAAAADKAAAAARAELEGVPGVADAAAVRAALLEGAASVEELFDMTRTQLGFDQQRDK